MLGTTQSRRCCFFEPTINIILFNLTALVEKMKHSARHSDGGHYLYVINIRQSGEKALLEAKEGRGLYREASSVFPEYYSVICPF